MNGFFVSITNNLLEDKHYEKMGNAVWLYMWLIDRMTDISEGQGIVNNGVPITHGMVNENFKTLELRTYQRMIKTLRDAGYINTVQAKYGLYVTVNKAKKQFGKKVETSYDKNDTASTKKAFKPRQNSRAAMPKVSRSPAKSDVALYIDNNTSTINNNNTSIGDKKSPAKIHREKVSKLYYEAIKALDLPVTNHNTLRLKINEMAKDADKDKIINYLKFMRDQFAETNWEYKPNITEALQIYSKRAKIRETFRAHVTGGQAKKGVKL